MGTAAATTPTRPSLLLRVRDPKDAAAWAAFVDLYGPLVFGHCRRRGLQHADAEDVTQQVFARVAQSVRTFEYDPAVGRFRDWLGTVVRNAVTRHLHARKPADASADLETTEARGDDSTWNDEFTGHILREALKQTRPRFEPETWRAFELVWVETRPAATVAAECGHPIDWVYSAKSRVLKQLWLVVRELADDSAFPGQPPT